jgi:hypothetical protein
MIARKNSIVMGQRSARHKQTLVKKYPPSEACKRMPIVNFTAQDTNPWNAVFAIMTVEAWDRSVMLTLKKIGIHRQGRHWF